MTKTEEIGNVLQQVSVDPCEILLENEYPEPRYSLTIGGIGTLPLGDIAAIKAKSKNGKTYLASIFGASVHGSDAFGMQSQVRGSTVLYFDTEQNERNTARVLRRMNALCGYDTKVTKQEVRAYSIRRIDTASRWAYITEQVNMRNPSVIIIDGIVDLVKDFNDPIESKEFVSNLLKFAQERDISIICILHTNKAKEDNNMRGHLGTILEQKAADIFEVVRNGSTFTVKETECRNQPIEEFSFVLDNDGMPHPSSTPIPISQQMKNNEITQTLKKVFEGETILLHNDIKRRYMQHTGCSDGTAKNRIKTALANGYLLPNENGGYVLPPSEASG